MTSYLGQSPEEVQKQVKNRYFYGLRRTDKCELFLGKLDQMNHSDSIQINKPGVNTSDYDNFERGADFYEGRNVAHEPVYSNLNYEQYKWDETNIWYYIDSEGELVASINRSHTYDDNSSTSGT